MKKRSIYNNPYKYAHICSIPYELAKIACLKQRHIKKEQRKNRPYRGDDFDVVLYYSSTYDKKTGWLNACGAKTLERWQEFARKEIIGR